MISGVGGSSAASVALATQSRPVQAPVETPNEVSAPPPGEATAFDIALQIQDVQYDNIKRTLDASKLVLDLLV